MPEGPEHFKAAQFINKCCNGRTFSGKIVKSKVSHRNPDIDFDLEQYFILAKARGKEVMLTIFQNDLEEENNSEMKIKKEEEHLETIIEKYQMNIVFQFGMSGCFKFTNADDLPKHSHLRFFTTDGMILSFVDVRRYIFYERLYLESYRKC